MRILIANKFWFRRGGLEKVMFDEIEALEAAGHEIIHFSTAHPDNFDSPYAGYFSPYIELSGGVELTLGEKARATGRLFTNREAAKGFERLLTDTRPDIVHAHGIHRQISPSILEVASRCGVPVVQSLHDLHKICPEDRLLRSGEHACVPPLCHRGWYLPAITNRCVHDSAAKSALAACELAYQRGRRVYERCVSRFVSPSHFLAQRLREDGWSSTPIDVVPNPVSPGPQRVGDDGYFLYAGRLARGKGIEVLLAAAASASVKVVVAGAGPMGDELRTRFPEAEFVGFKDPEGVRGLLEHARAAVLPSSCAENAPLGVLEAMAGGVPVIATTVGGIPELLDDEAEGLLVPAEDVDALAAALRRLSCDDALAVRLGVAGRRRAETDYGIDRHIESLLDTYCQAGAKLA